MRILLVVIMSSLTTLPAWAEEDSPTHRLWTGGAFPDRNTIPWVEGMQHKTIHQPANAEDYLFLHGAAIIEHDGVWYANWANSRVDENSATETMRGRRSTDGGQSWSEIELIAPGFDDRECHSHGCLAVHNDQVWAFAARFGEGAGKRFPGLTTEAFVLDPSTDRWVSQGAVMTDCWPYNEPFKLPNGNYITAGQDKDGLPVVAISDGDDFLKWDAVKIPYPPALQPAFAETTLLQTGKELLAIIRGGGGVAWLSTSDDQGRTWSTAVRSNYPMPRAKAYIGRLSSGHPYLISNLGNRDTLAISVGDPDGNTLQRVWKIRDGKSEPPRYPGRAKSKQWSYPYAHEHDGKLYVVYSIGKEECGLSILPLKSITP